MNETERRRILKRPLSIQESGLSTGALAELALKLIYNIGEVGASEISKELRPPFSGVIQPVLQLLDREELVKITGSNGFGEGFVHLVREWYVKPKRAFKNAHPRDILDRLLDIARYKRRKPTTEPHAIDQACRAYFADL